MNTIVSFFLKRKWILVSLCVVVPVGFLFKGYSGPLHKWFNDYGAGLVYEVFWCLVVFFFIPDRKYIATIAVSVFAVTSVLEVLQLWQVWFLQQVRSSFLGRVILGTTFVWWDFPHYILGSLLGWFWMRAISKGAESADSHHFRN